MTSSLFLRNQTQTWHANADRKLGADPSGRNPWQPGSAAPEKPGCYERGFTDGAYCNYWNGQVWMPCKDRVKPHLRQVGDYPVWRMNREEPCPTTTSKHHHENTLSEA